MLRRMTRMMMTASLALACACAGDVADDAEELASSAGEIDQASEALTASFRTLTVLNQNQNLASNLSGTAVTTTPNASSTLQHFELLFPGSAGSSEPGFGSAYQLKNRATQKCLQDATKDQPVREVTCLANPAPKSTQLWQNHIADDRVVNGKRFLFIFSRNSGRVLSREPIFGSTAKVLSSVRASNTGSAAAALQLWTLTRI